MPERWVIEAEGLVKEYGGEPAVKGISFRVEAGECFGFLGPNGAGKTTTVRLVQCLSPISGGSLRVLGLEVTRQQREIKARLGVVPQEDSLDQELTVLENLLVYAGYFGLGRAEARLRAAELLEFVGLLEDAGKPAAHLSGGQKRRLTIARALVNRPQLLILDEPTTGLDPQARRMVWQRLRQLREDGVTLLLTTHYMEEATQLCTRLVVMDHGEILAEGEPRELVAGQIGREVLEVAPADPAAAARAAEALGTGSAYRLVGDTLFLFVKDGREASERLALAGLEFPYRLQRPASLEDVFLKLTGHGLDSEEVEHGEEAKY